LILSLNTTSWSHTALTDVNNRAPLRVCNGAAQHFMGDRRRISLAEKDVAKEVCHRIAFRPAEVCVGNLSRSPLQFDEQGRYRVCHHRAAGKKNAVPAHPSSIHGQRILELRRIAAFHLEEKQAFVRIKIMQIANLRIGLVPVGLGPVLRLVRDHPYQLVRVFTNHRRHLFVESNSRDA
jgi:hypothetical protein